MSKYAKMGAFVAVFAVALMLCAGFSMAQVDFRKSSYEAAAGTNAEMLIDLDYTALNTTSDDIDGVSYAYYCMVEGVEGPQPGLGLGNFSEDDIDYMTDFDDTTSVNLSYDGDATDAYCLIADVDLDCTGEYWFTIDPLASFDGVWLKKTQQTAVSAIYLYNNTIGAGSEAILLNEDSTDIFTVLYSNKSYNIVGEDVLVSALGSDLSWSEYVNTYGYVDNITLYLDSTDATAGSIETLLYEFHLFNTRPYIDTIVITNEAGDQTLAWGTDTEQDGSVVTLTVSIPATATAGAYFVTATDNLGNSDVTTLRVSENLVTDSTNIIVTLLCIIGGGALLATAGILANSKKDWEGVIVLSVVGIIVLGYGVMRALDTAGYIPEGWPGNGFAGFIAVGLVGLGGAWNRIVETVRKHKAGIVKGFALGLVCAVALCAFVPMATATDTVTPANRTSNQGDIVTFTLTSDAETGYYDEDEITVNIYKVDVVLAPIEVFWTYTVTVSEDELTATVRITIPSGAAAGTYTVEIDQPQQDVSEDVTIYIPEEQGLNLPILFTMILGGILLAFVFPALSWAAVKRTKGKADDAFVIVAAILGVLMLVGAAAYYFGYWTL